MEDQREQFNQALRRFGEIGIEINKFYKEKLPTMNLQDVQLLDELYTELQGVNEQCENLLENIRELSQGQK